MTRSVHDHECRTYLAAADYIRLIRHAANQDRSLSEFQRHAIRRYMDWIEAQTLPRDSSPPLGLFSESEG